MRRFREPSGVSRVPRVQGLLADGFRVLRRHRVGVPLRQRGGGQRQGHLLLGRLLGHGERHDRDFSRMRRRFPTNARAHEKRAPGWGPRRLADTPLESGDAREAKACATEAHGTRRPTRVGVCGLARASSAAPSCHERFFCESDLVRFRALPGSLEEKVRFDRRSGEKPRCVVVGADDDASAALSRAPPPIS